VNEYLVERLDPAVWRATPPMPKPRTIAAIVAHAHNCSLAYLKRVAPGVSVPPELDRFHVTQAGAVKALAAKRRAVIAAIGPLLENNPRIASTPHDAATFLAYYMAHDAHHRGQIVSLARLLGHPISKETEIGMWTWSARARESGIA
jgi:uncharacterized damage-inducible protein DinB